MYDYKDKSVDVRTNYVIEWTWDMKTAEKVWNTGDFTLLCRQEKPDLEGALMLYNYIYYSRTLEGNCAPILNLYEQVILDGEIVLEQSKDYGFRIPQGKTPDKIILDLQAELDEAKRKQEVFEDFLDKYHARELWKEFSHD